MSESEHGTPTPAPQPTPEIDHLELARKYGAEADGLNYDADGKEALHRAQMHAAIAQAEALTRIANAMEAK